MMMVNADDDDDDDAMHDGRCARFFFFYLQRESETNQACKSSSQFATNVKPNKKTASGLHRTFSGTVCIMALIDRSRRSPCSP